MKCPVGNQIGRQKIFAHNESAGPCGVYPRTCGAAWPDSAAALAAWVSFAGYDILPLRQIAHTRATPMMPAKT